MVRVLKAVESREKENAHRCWSDGRSAQYNCVPQQNNPSTAPRGIRGESIDYDQMIVFFCNLGVIFMRHCLPEQRLTPPPRTIVFGGASLRIIGYPGNVIFDQFRGVRYVDVI